MTDTVMEKAVALAEALVESDEFKAIRQKQDAAFNHMISLELLQKYEATKKAYQIKINNDEATEEDAKALEALEAKVYEDRLLRELIEARDAYQKMLNEVMATILKAQKEAMDKVQ